MNREGLPARLPAQSPAGGGGCARHTLPSRRGVQSPSVGCPHGRRPCWRWASMFCRGNPADAASARSDAAACSSSIGRIGTPCLLDLHIKSFWNARFPSGNVQSVRACFNASCGPFVVCVWCVAPQAAVFRRPMLSPCEPAASGLPIPVLLTAYRPYFAQAAAIRV
jgi:hypothetical protein